MMFTALTNLATRRAKFVMVAVIVVTLTTGAIGGGVAGKLSSFGADDPATDSFKAAERLADATALDANPGLIALVLPVGVLIGIYLTDMSQFPKVNDVYATFFTEPFPVRTTIGVAALPKGAMVEMDATVPLEQESP